MLSSEFVEQANHIANLYAVLAETRISHSRAKRDYDEALVTARAAQNLVRGLEVLDQQRGGEVPKSAA